MGGFAGIIQEQGSGRRAYTFPWGFRGIVQEFPDNVRFIKVTDFKGVPLANVAVTVNNTVPVTTITNQDGIAEIVPDPASIVTIDLLQFSMGLTGVSYDTDNEPPTRTIILDTIVPHL